MSQNAAISSLESLELQSQMITRLKNAGIESVFDLAISIPQDLFEQCGLTDERLALDLVMKAKKALIDSGTLSKDFSTADQILERRQNLFKCSTGSSRLDSFLKGGIETQAMTEIAGEYASGKSQLCYTLSVTATLPLNKGGFNGSVIFIDTENTFRSERIHQIAENRGINPDKVLQKVFVCKVLNAGQLELVAQNLGKSIQEYNAKLVIVDSIISLHRAEFAGRETIAERQKRLNVMLHKLLRLAEVHNIAVIVTNQVQSQPDNFFANGGYTSKVTGGNILGHASTYRILIKKAGRARIAIMLDSPHHAYDQTKFLISERGVDDIEELRVGRKSEPEW
jgi:DNA repair protein RadA